jgi:endonuclease-3 related protein
MDGQRINKIWRYVYQRLLERYGPQHWWPAQEPFEVIVGAILTQSAAWVNVEKAINNLSAAGKLSPEALRSLPEAELSVIIRPCGYYNVKARKLKAFVNWLGECYDDNLDKLFTSDIEHLRKQLLDIYGIGEETADSIILYAGNKPVFVIDAYTRRIIDRMGMTPSNHSYAGYQLFFMANLPTDTNLFNEYHALLVRHAKEVCRKLPLCQRCCLNPKEKTSQRKAGTQYPCAAIRRRYR